MMLDLSKDVDCVDEEQHRVSRSSAAGTHGIHKVQNEERLDCAAVPCSFRHSHTRLQPEQKPSSRGSYSCASAKETLKAIQ
jgi:hypothetical protein